MKKISGWVRKLKWWVKGLTIVLVVITVSYYLYQKQNSTSEVSYTTSSVVMGNLVTSISASGSISSGNTTNISTKASGVVSGVYVKNGDRVTKGEKLLAINLDTEGVARRSEAWTAYLKAKEAVTQAIKDKQDLEITIWQNKQAILDAQDAKDAKNLNSDKYTDAEKNEIDLKVNQAQLAFDVNADKYSHADNAISAARINAQTAYEDYLDVSGSIVAPTDGIINNLTLTVGSTLVASSSQSTSSGATYASSQVIGFVRSSNNEYLAQVSLTEVDAPKVEAGQKVILTMDAHSDKSFTGKVLAVDVAGSSSSGVSSYPATIVMDATDLAIYPNMSVSATIIVSTEKDVLLVPSSAINTSNGVSTVSVISDGNMVTKEIEIGSSNGTETVVNSGLSSGEAVVTSQSNSVKNDNTSSVFSSNRSSGGIVRMGGPGF